MTRVYLQKAKEKRAKQEEEEQLVGLGQLYRRVESASLAWGMMAPEPSHRQSRRRPAWRGEWWRWRSSFWCRPANAIKLKHTIRF